MHPALRKLVEEAEAKGGVAIPDPNQGTVQPVVRSNAEVARDWEYAEQARFLYRWAVVFKERLLDPVLVTDRRRLPDPVISFDRMRHETLAAYTLARNPQGLLYEITFNTMHLGRAQWETLETLLHEMVHLWQQNFGQHAVKPPKVYHNAEFVAKCESLGLHPRPAVGSHWRPADGLFEMLMREHGIAPPDYVVVSLGEKRFDWWDLGKEQKGRSTLAKWSCGCQNVRVGTKEFYAQCLRCGNIFVKVEAEAQQEAGHRRTLYKADEAEQRMSWQDHQEGIYQPKIHSDRIHELHELAVLTGEPMTTLVNLALQEYYLKSKTAPPAPGVSDHRQEDR
jgi:hypothetical protein